MSRYRPMSLGKGEGQRNLYFMKRNHTNRNLYPKVWYKKKEKNRGANSNHIWLQNN